MEGIVVIGASQGGIHALRTLVSRLPADFPAPLVAVVHIGSGPSVLPSILNEVGGISAKHASHGVTLEAGCLYIAPPDQHVLVVDGHLELSHGPRENWARPAVDPLLRSAAEVYGPAAIGVVLTGRLNDGSAGLYEIKRRGGIAIVQEPAEAEAPGMPENALQNVAVDYRLALAEIPGALIRILEDMAALPATPKAAGESFMEEIITPIAQTCPECGGAMIEQRLGKLTRFRCHIGHAMTAEVMAAAQMEVLEANLDSALRMLNERAALARSMSERHAIKGEENAAAAWRQASEQAAHVEETVKRLTGTAWIHPEESES